jgi:predicted nuclease of predicted toxin-antitoxin system
MAALRFYLDENVQTVIADQLRLRGIETVIVRDLGALGEDDEHHLSRAAAMGYVLCTHDTDYCALATQGFQHAGIIWSG